MSTAPPPFNRSRPAPLRGRDDLVEELLGVVRDAADGRGGARTLVGAPGVGKTSILEEAVRRAQREVGPPLRVVRVRGLEAEVEMAWSGLASLLEPFLPALGDLPAARSAAIRGALALADGGAPVEPFAVAVATRDLLAGGDATAPIVVLVDDVPWIDEPTRIVLTYIADDIELEPIAVLAARRTDGHAAAALGTVIEVGGLADDVADQLLADAGVSSAEVRRRLREASGGNPLVLVEAANLLEPDERAGRAVLPDPLPVGSSGQRAAELVLDRLDPATRAALVVVAADADGDAGRLGRALAAGGHDVDSLRVAVDAGVLIADGSGLLFRHPLIRAATYHGASRTAQRAAHRALATTLPERSPARAWHLARSALGPDEEIAAALDAAATMTAHLGAPNLAARTWEASSRLSPRGADRARRMRQAAAAELDAGLTREAAELLARAEQLAAADPGADDAVERTHRLRLRCRFPPALGGPTHPRALLRQAADEVEADDPGLAADVRMDALERAIDDGALADMLGVAESLIAMRDRVDAERRRRIEIVRGGTLLLRGNPRGTTLLGRFREISGPDRPLDDARFLACVVAPALAYLRHTAAADELLDVLEADLRSRGAIRPLVDVLSAQAMAHYGRSFPTAIAAAVDALTLAQSLGIPAALAASALGLAAAVVGDRPRCEQAAAVLAAVEAPERRALGTVSLAYLALNEGRLEDADALYRELADELPLGRGLIRWETEWVETLAKLGRRAEGAEVLDRLVAGGNRPDVLLLHEYERARGFVADDEATAHGHFARSVEDAIAQGNPFAEGRARLAWGEQLRRVRRRADARAHLDAAIELFTRVGATSFADRAASEARAAGGYAAAPETVAHRLLTPHELQIARLVVGGASTRDVAAKLFISPRTIEAHLSTIFRKLGVRNRGELAARALDDPVLQPT